MSFSLVSVCIPCFNAAAYLKQAVQSVLCQTWPAIEVIVVDDGSTDCSLDVLKALVSPRVRLIHQENRGQCAAANRAFAEAQGELIKFFDADDLLAPETIASQIRRLDGRKDAIASARWGRFYHDSLSTFKLNPQSVWRDMASQDWLVEAWSEARPMMQCGLWLIPREILSSSGGWDESLSLINDFEFFARVLLHANEVLFTPEAVLYYRSGLQDSLSGQKSRKAVESAFHSLLLGTSCLLKHRNDEAARRSCANVLQDFIYTYYPDHADLCQVMQQRVEDLGGSDLAPSGGLRFEQLRRLVGWKAAKRLQKLAGRA